ncbi:hypothetical protein B0H11DRAFT_2248526 [Mycena galericulata]|nr:hypothetical protein B0H11DRAFT_2248526 [Mycena galericulata]
MKKGWGAAGGCELMKGWIETRHARELWPADTLPTHACALFPSQLTPTEHRVGCGPPSSTGGVKLQCRLDEGDVQTSVNPGSRALENEAARNILDGWAPQLRPGHGRQLIGYRPRGALEGEECGCGDQPAVLRGEVDWLEILEGGGWPKDDFDAASAPAPSPLSPAHAVERETVRAGGAPRCARRVERDSLVGREECVKARSSADCGQWMWMCGSPWMYWLETHGGDFARTERPYSPTPGRRWRRPHREDDDGGSLKGGGQNEAYPALTGRRHRSCPPTRGFSDWNARRALDNLTSPRCIRIHQTFDAPLLAHLLRVLKVYSETHLAVAPYVPHPAGIAYQARCPPVTPSPSLTPIPHRVRTLLAFLHTDDTRAHPRVESSG